MSSEEQLRHIADRMEESSRVAVDAANKLALEVELARQLATEDRVQIARLLVLMQRLADGVERLEETSRRVAAELAASIARADDAPTDVPGAGADAALRSADEELPDG